MSTSYSAALAGEVLAFGAISQAKPLLPVVDNSIKSELATQHVTPRQEFMVVATAGEYLTMASKQSTTLLWLSGHMFN